MLHSTIAKIERRTSGIRRKNKKISSSALKTAPEPTRLKPQLKKREKKKGGGGGGGGDYIILCNALYYKLIYSFSHPFLVRNFWVADRVDLCTLSYLVA